MGDIVDVTGTVVEYFNFTEFSPVTSVTVDSSGNPLPAAIELDATVPPTDPAAAWCADRVRAPARGCWSTSRAASRRAPTSASPATSAPRSTASAARTGPSASPASSTPASPACRSGTATPRSSRSTPTASARPPTPTTFRPARPTPPPASWPTSSATGSSGRPRSPSPRRPCRARSAPATAASSRSAPTTSSSSTRPPSDYAARLQKHSAYIRTVLGAPDVLGVQECMSITELTALAARIHTDDASLTYTRVPRRGPRRRRDRRRLPGARHRHRRDRDPARVRRGLRHGRLLRCTTGRRSSSRPRTSATARRSRSRSWSTTPVPSSASTTPSTATVFATSGSRRRSGSPRRSRTTRRRNPLRPFVMVGDLNAYEISDGYVDVVGQMAGDFVAADNLLSGPDLVNPNLTKQALTVPATDRYSYNFDGHGAGPRPRPDDPGHEHLGARLRLRARQHRRRGEPTSTTPATPLRSSDHDGAVLFLMSDANADGVPGRLAERRPLPHEGRLARPGADGRDPDLHAHREQRRSRRGRPDHGDRHAARRRRRSSPPPAPAGPACRAPASSSCDAAAHARRHGDRHHRHRDRHGDVRHADEHRRGVVVHHRPEPGEQRGHHGHDRHRRWPTSP